MPSRYVPPPPACSFRVSSTVEGARDSSVPGRTNGSSSWRSLWSCASIIALASHRRQTAIDDHHAARRERRYIGEEIDGGTGDLRRLGMARQRGAVDHMVAQHRIADDRGGEL